jgi:hypothetical protein
MRADSSFGRQPIATSRKLARALWDGRYSRQRPLSRLIGSLSGTSSRVPGSSTANSD